MTKVNHHEVAFVAEQRENGRAALIVPLKFGERLGCLGGDLVPLFVSQRLPVSPANPEHLMKYARPVERQGHDWGIAGPRHSFDRRPRVR